MNWRKLALSWFSHPQQIISIDHRGSRCRPHASDEATYLRDEINVDDSLSSSCRLASRRRVEMYTPSMQSQQSPADPTCQPLAPGLCPLCRSRIDTPLGWKFECSNCHRMVQTSRAYRILRMVVSFALAAGICLTSNWPWFLKVFEWPIIAYILGVVFDTLAGFVRTPSYREFHPRTKNESLQKLGSSS